MATLHQPLPAISWRSHLNTLWAIFRKDLTQFVRYPLNALAWSFQPLIFLVPVFFMGQAFSVDGEARGFAGYSGTTDYISFILIGTVLNNYINAVFWGIGYALKNDMDAGVLESNWLTPASRPLLMIGRTFTNLLQTTITSAITLAVAALLFGFSLSGNIFAAALTVLPLLVGLYGFGIAFAALVLIMRDANTLVDMSSYLVGLFSGSQFPVNALPRWLMPVALILPLTYGFDAVRGWLLHTTTLLPIPVEIALMMVFMVIMIWLGMFVFKRLERRVRMMGTLGQH